MNQGQTQLMNHNWNNAKVKYPGLTETCLMVYASVFYKNLHGWFITNYHQIYLLALFNHSMKLKPCVNPPCVTDNCSVYTLIIWMIKCLILSYSNYISIKKEEQIVIFFVVMVWDSRNKLTSITVRTQQQGKRRKWKLPTPVSRLHGPLQEQEHPTQTIQELLELLLKVQCKVSRPEI